MLNVNTFAVFSEIILAYTSAEVILNCHFRKPIWMKLVDQQLVPLSSRFKCVGSTLRFIAHSKDNGVYVCQKKIDNKKEQEKKKVYVGSELTN